MIYPAANAIVQAEAAERAGMVGHTEVDGDLPACSHKPFMHNLLNNRHECLCGHTSEPIGARCPVAVCLCGKEKTLNVQITAPVAKKLKAFSLRLRLHGQTAGATCIGVTRYDIETEGIGTYRIVAINGKEPGEEAP